MYDQEASERSRSPGSAREKVAEVAETAKHEMGTVADEVKHQAGRVASDVRTRVREQASHGQHELADRLRQGGEELRAMAADRESSPARTTVEQLASRTEQVADYLAKHGPEELLADVQDFARRRPGVFLVSAAVAGFVVGRLAKGVVAERTSGGSGDGSTYRSTYATGSPATTAVDQVPAVGVATAPDAGPTYAAGVAPVPTSVAAEPVPPETAPPTPLPPTQVPPAAGGPAPGGEQR
jgi:hypothetical protein